MPPVNCSGWNPFREMEELLDRYNRSTGRAAPDLGEDLSTSDWLPYADIEETAATYRIRAELPGVRKQDIVVSFHGGALGISGEKHAELKSEEGHRRHLSECLFGNFHRTFNLPQQVEIAAATAAYTDGVLTIEIPKAKQSADYEHRLTIN